MPLAEWDLAVAAVVLGWDNDINVIDPPIGDILKDPQETVTSNPMPWSLIVPAFIFGAFDRNAAQE